MTRKLAPGFFHGKQLQSHAIDGFRLSEWSYAPDLRFPRHAHERAFFNMVIQGRYTETCGARSRTCEPFTLVFRPPGEAHTDHIHGAGARIFDIEIEPRWLDRVGELSRGLDHPTEFTHGLPVWLARRLYDEFQRMDDVSPLAMEGMALELLAETTRRTTNVSQRRPRRWLLEARDLLHARFTERLSLDQIARTVGVHPDHLAHVFRQQYRCTVGEYVRQLRVDFACRQLTCTDRPLAEIALAAGFADQSHFSKTFKSRMGMAPAEFQRSFRRHQ